MASSRDQEHDAADQVMSFGRRARRSLARRFPRARHVYHSVLDTAKRLRSVPRQSVAARRFLRTCRDTARQRQDDSRLTVGVDISPLWEPLTGVGWYLYRLLEHLANRDDVRIRLYPPTIFLSHQFPHGDPLVELPSGPALEAVAYDLPDVLAVDHIAVNFVRRWEADLVRRDRNQVLFAPNYFLPRLFNRVPGALVATIHDLGFRKVPWTLREETLSSLAERLDKTLTSAALLITVSNTVRDELVSFGYAPRDQIRVVHHGAGLLEGIAAGALPSGVAAPFGLHVGTLEPRKNVSSLLACWRLLRDQVPDLPPLVLCGRFGWKSQDLEAEVAAAEEEGWLLHLGYVPEDELARLYAEAFVVVFPTLYEGFGLPAVEAMAARTPLVCSDIPVLHEVAGEAALFASPQQPEAMARQVRKVLTDDTLRRELISRGTARLEDFDWNKTAEETLAVWREAASSENPSTDKGG